MNNVRLTEILSVASDAVASFLETILREASAVRIDAGNIYEAEGTADLLTHPINLALKADGQVVAGVSVSEEWLETLSQAMLGLPLKMDEEGADDLIRELSAQVAGTIRSSLSGIDVNVPEFEVEIVSEAEDAVEGIDDLIQEVLIEVDRPDAPLRGVILLKAMPQPQAEPEVQPAADAGPTPAPDRQQQSVPNVNISAASFPELGQESISSGDGAGFGLLSEVELEVTVELGRRRLPLADVLRLTTGSVIELEKLVGEPLEVYANGRLIAEGEAVVIDEQFGIRITNLVSSTKRTKAFI